MKGREMSIEDFWNDINAAAIERRRRYGHIANYPARLVERLIQENTLTVEERNELIQFKLKRAEQQKKGVTQEGGE
jgi:hypothetical protein